MVEPGLSLRWQLAIWSIAFGLFFGALGFVAMLPLLRRAASLEGSGEVLPLLAVVSLLGAGLLSLAIYALLWRLVARPADRLLRATQRIASSAEGPILAERGPVLGRLGTAFDRMSARLVEEQIRVERQLEELRRINRELAETRDAMVRQEKLATVGRISAGIAHEIGNPLSAILGYVELLRSRQELLPWAEWFERMEREARRIDRIVRDLLDYARPTRSREPGPVDPGPAVERAIRLVSGQRRIGAVAIERAIPERLPLVLADEHHMQQVLVNLLVNAADAMGGEGRILVSLEEGEGRLAIRVRDTGPGIAEADLPRIFDPFFTTKEPGAGTGLGLSISLSLVESMGGTIAARNHPEGGAEFVVTLPVVEVD